MVRDKVTNDATLKSSLFAKYPFHDKNKKMLLVISHRRENYGGGFERICYALIEIARNHNNVQLVYPVHLNPNVRKPVQRILYSINNITLIDPQDYLPFIYLMNKTYLILTDSGAFKRK